MSTPLWDIFLVDIYNVCYTFCRERFMYVSFIDIFIDILLCIFFDTFIDIKKRIFHLHFGRYFTMNIVYVSPQKIS